MSRRDDRTSYGDSRHTAVSGVIRKKSLSLGICRRPRLMLPPHSPKMNARVEYVHGTCRREFYECTEMAADLEAMRRQ